MSLARIAALIAAPMVSIAVGAAQGAAARDAAWSASDARVLAVLDAEALDQQAFLRIVGAGPAVVPTLIAAIGDCAVERAPVVRRRRRALRALRLIGGPAADRAIPAVLDGISRDMSRDDRDLIDTLRELALHVDEVGAIQQLAAAVEMPAPKAQVDFQGFLRWCMKKGLYYDFQMRLTLRDAGAADLDERVETLVQQLSADDAFQRRYAAERLGRIGPSAIDAIEALIVVEKTEEHPRVGRAPGIGTMTYDFHDLIRDEAALAIARIDPGHPQARRGLTLQLRCDDPRERFAAMMAMTPPPQPGAFDVVPAVVAATADDDPRIAAEAITTLMRLDARRPEVLARLRACEASSNAAVRRSAEVALRVLTR